MKMKLKIVSGGVRNEIVGVKKDELKVRTVLKIGDPVFNFELVKFLSETMKIKKRDIRIYDNGLSDSKVVEFPDTADLKPYKGLKPVIIPLLAKRGGRPEV